jgi:hypothetical protein
VLEDVADQDGVELLVRERQPNDVGADVDLAVDVTRHVAGLARAKVALDARLGREVEDPVGGIEQLAEPLAERAVALERAAPGQRAPGRGIRPCGTKSSKRPPQHSQCRPRRGGVGRRSTAKRLRMATVAASRVISSRTRRRPSSPRRRASSRLDASSAIALASACGLSPATTAGDAVLHHLRLGSHRW